MRVSTVELCCYDVAVACLVDSCQVSGYFIFRNKIWQLGHERIEGYVQRVNRVRYHLSGDVAREQIAVTKRDVTPPGDSAAVLVHGRYLAMEQGAVSGDVTRRNDIMFICEFEGRMSICEDIVCLNDTNGAREYFDESRFSDA
jgi:hypothetical protein